MGTRADPAAPEDTAFITAWQAQAPFDAHPELFAARLRGDAVTLQQLGRVASLTSQHVIGRTTGLPSWAQRIEALYADEALGAADMDLGLLNGFAPIITRAAPGMPFSRAAPPRYSVACRARG